MRQAKIAVISIVDTSGQPIESFVYVNGEVMEDLPSEEAESLVHQLPIEVLNEIYISEVMPRNLKDLEKLLDQD